jgi:hypothetical protein
MVVLMAFNKKDQWTFEELVAETGMNGVAPEALPAIFWLNQLRPYSAKLKVTLRSRKFHKKNSKF